MTDSHFRPDWISPPGETIEDLLEEHGWTKAELAKRLGVTPKHVNELVKGRAPITPDTAERLSRVLGSTSQFWLTREARYQAALERRKAAQAAQSHAAWLTELPLTFMKKQGWLRSYKDKGEQVLEALSFFRVNSVEVWREQYEAPLVAFRASQAHPKKAGAVAAWLCQGQREAAKVACAPYDPDRFKQALTDLRALTHESDSAHFMPKLTETCAACGVAVVFVPAPTGCPASGATQWLTPHKAMLLLSLRHRTNDHLWFTFFHEAAHLLYHGKKLLFVEGDAFDDEHEAEADRFARDWLISSKDAQRLKNWAQTGELTPERVVEFAQEIGIAPGIVVGRLQKEKMVDWSKMNHLKVRYSWALECAGLP